MLFATYLELRLTQVMHVVSTVANKHH